MTKDDLRQINCPPKHIDDYQKLLPEIVKRIKLLAFSLKGLRIAHINATAYGGGVVKMLKFLVPLQNDLGLDSKWYVIPQNGAFFEVTKQIHNMLQGQAGDLSEEKKKIYLQYN